MYVIYHLLVGQLVTHRLTFGDSHQEHQLGGLNSMGIYIHISVSCTIFEVTFGWILNRLRTACPSYVVRGRFENTY